MRISYIQVKPISRYIVCWGSQIGWIYPDVTIILFLKIIAIKKPLAGLDKYYF
jgi:hypothetical protein